MRIVIDLDRLIAEGRIDSEEYERLKSPAALGNGSPGNGLVAANVLLGFCVIVCAAEVLFRLGSAPVAACAGLGPGIPGADPATRRDGAWGLLGILLVSLGSVVATLAILFLAIKNMNI